MNKKDALKIKQDQDNNGAQFANFKPAIGAAARVLGPEHLAAVARLVNRDRSLPPAPL